MAVSASGALAGSESQRCSLKGRQSKRSESRYAPVRARHSASPPWKGFGNANLVTIYGAVFDHVAGPTRLVEGSVRDQETGKPLAGIMVRGERSLSDSTNVYVQSISDVQGTFRLIGLPRGNEGAVVAVPPCDFEVYGSLDADMKVPPHEELPYLRARVAVAEGPGDGPLRLDIRMKRGVWVTGRVIEKATGKPARGLVEYFVCER